GVISASGRSLAAASWRPKLRLLSTRRFSVWSSCRALAISARTSSRASARSWRISLPMSEGAACAAMGRARQALRTAVRSRVMVVSGGLVGGGGGEEGSALVPPPAQADGAEDHGGAGDRADPQLRGQERRVARL